MNKKAFVRHYELGGTAVVQLVYYPSYQELDISFDTIEAARAYALSNNIILIQINNNEITDQPNRASHQ